MNNTSSPTSAINHFQVILSNIPHINGHRKSYTFSKKTSNNYLDYYDLFKFIENKSGIPRRYFIISQGQMRIKFTSLINNITSHNTRFIPTDAVDLFNVSINLYADTIMFYKHKKMIQAASYTSRDTLMNTIKAICNYTNILNRKHPIISDYCELLQSYCCNEIIKDLSNSYDPPLFVPQYTI